MFGFLRASVWRWAVAMWAQYEGVTAQFDFATAPLSDLHWPVGAAAVYVALVLVLLPFSESRAAALRPRREAFKAFLERERAGLSGGGAGEGAEEAENSEEVDDPDVGWARCIGLHNLLLCVMSLVMLCGAGAEVWLRFVDTERALSALCEGGKCTEPGASCTGSNAMAQRRFGPLSFAAAQPWPPAPFAEALPLQGLDWLFCEYGGSDRAPSHNFSRPRVLASIPARPVSVLRLAHPRAGHWSPAALHPGKEKRGGRGERRSGESEGEGGKGEGEKGGEGEGEKEEEKEKEKEEEKGRGVSLLRIRPGGPLFFWSYLYYLSKYYELLDTVLTLAAGKSIPSLRLHVFHHAAVLLMAWLWLASRQSLQFVGLLFNTLVHVVMYYYYFRRANPRAGVPWWKAWVTRLQVVQFLTSFACFVAYLLFAAPAPLQLASAEAFQPKLLFLDLQATLATRALSTRLQAGRADLFSEGLLSLLAPPTHPVSSPASHGFALSSLTAPVDSSPQAVAAAEGVSPLRCAGGAALWYNLFFNATLLYGFLAILNGRKKGPRREKDKQKRE